MRALLVAVALTVPAACTGEEHGDAPSGASGAGSFYSCGLLEPDKVASGWLIHRHAVPGAGVSFLPQGAGPPLDSVPFDMPGARWLRQPTRSTFETILELEGIEEPALRRIGELIRRGEIAYWSLEPGSPDERFDRVLKDLAGRDDVTALYAYLDAVYAAGGEVPATWPPPAR